MQLGSLIELNCHTERRAVFVLAVVLLSWKSHDGEDKLRKKDEQTENIIDTVCYPSNLFQPT